MTNEELLNKYPSGIILSIDEKIEIYKKLESNAILNKEEAEKLYDTLNFLENSCYTLGNVVMIVKRQLALLRLNMKFSLEILPTTREDSADFFSKELEFIDTIIKTELNRIDEQETGEQESPESFGEESKTGENSDSGGSN